MPAKTTDTNAAAPKAKSTVSKDGTHKCPACKESLPATKFPTIADGNGGYVRSTDECRSCRHNRRDTKKAERKRNAAA